MIRSNPSHAPTKRFRGKRRYFEAVRRDATAFEVNVSPDAWWDLWHYHADWPGWGNLRWSYRLEHIRALCTVFKNIARARRTFPKPFQSWILISGESASQDATYLHTPNANGTPFPMKPTNIDWKGSSLGAVFAELLPEYALHVGVHVVSNSAGLVVRGAHFVWADDVGEPLV